MGVHHEPDELSGKLCSPAEEDGARSGDPPAGGRHLGGLLRAHLSKDFVTLTQFSTPAAAILVTVRDYVLNERGGEAVLCNQSVFRC